MAASQNASFTPGRISNPYTLAPYWTDSFKAGFKFVLKPNASLRKAICLDFLFNLLFFFLMFCIGKISALHFKEGPKDLYLYLLGSFLFVIRLLLFYILAGNVTRRVCPEESVWSFHNNLTRSFFWKRLITFLLQITFYAVFVWLPLNFFFSAKELFPIGAILFLPLLVLQGYLVRRLTFLPYEATSKTGENLREPLKLGKGIVLRTLILKFATYQVAHFLMCITYLIFFVLGLVLPDEQGFSIWKKVTSFLLASSGASLFVMLHLGYFAALAHYYQSTCVIKPTFKPAPRTETPPVPQPLADANSSATIQA
jgi:hypothetical protein